jgi:hypothetical protein
MSRRNPGVGYWAGYYVGRVGCEGAWLGGCGASGTYCTLGRLRPAWAKSAMSS